MDFDDFRPIRNYNRIISSDTLEKPKVKHFTAEADGACLFHAVAQLLRDVDPHISHFKLRHAVISVLERNSDDFQYSEAMLGMPISVYIAEMREQESWGGGVELAILSDILQLEIMVLDVKSQSEMTFGEASGYTRRIFLQRASDHYSGLGMIGTMGRPLRMFAPTDDLALQLMIDYSAGVLEREKAQLYRCDQCQARLEGQHAMAGHSTHTGHTNYSVIQ